MAKFISDGFSNKLTVSSFCPFCFRVLNAATNLESKDEPEEGDFTICIDCAQVLRWDEKMQLMKASLEEIPVEYRFGFAKVVMSLKKMRGIG